MYKLIFFILTLLLSSQAQAKWRYYADRDPFTDEKASTAIKSNPGFEGSSLVIRCKDGNLESYIATNNYLGSDGYNSVRFRFNKEEAESEAWGISTSGSALFSQFAVEFARKVVKYSNLVIEVENYSGEKYLSKFSLAGSSGPVGRVLTDCKLMRQDPRDVDSLIWRRVVQDIDDLNIDTANELSEIIDFLTDDDKPNGDRRKINIYKSVSNIYTAMYQSCIKNEGFATELPSCRSYHRKLEIIEEADYSVDTVTLLVEIFDKLSSKSTSDE